MYSVHFLKQNLNRNMENALDVEKRVIEVLLSQVLFHRISRLSVFKTYNLNLNKKLINYICIINTHNQ